MNEIERSRFITHLTKELLEIVDSIRDWEDVDPSDVNGGEHAHGVIIRGLRKQALGLATAVAKNKYVDLFLEDREEAIDRVRADVTEMER